MTLLVASHLRIFCEMLRFWEHHQEFLGPPFASGGVQTPGLDALGLALTCPGVEWIFRGEKIELDPSFQGF